MLLISLILHLLKCIIKNHFEDGSMDLTMQIVMYMCANRNTRQVRAIRSTAAWLHIAMSFWLMTSNEMELFLVTLEVMKREV